MAEPFSGEGLSTLAIVWRRDRGCCRYCGIRVQRRSRAPRPLTAKTLDHVHPRWLGGETSVANCVVACLDCNQRKGGKTLEEAKMVLLPVPDG